MRGSLPLPGVPLSFLEAVHGLSPDPGHSRCPPVSGRCASRPSLWSQWESSRRPGGGLTAQRQDLHPRPLGGAGTPGRRPPRALRPLPWSLVQAGCPRHRRYPRLPVPRPFLMAHAQMWREAGRVRVDTSELGVCLGLEFRGTSVLRGSLAFPAVCCCGGGRPGRACVPRKRFSFAPTSPLAGTGVFVLVLRTRRAALD